MAVRCSVTHYIDNVADVEFPADFVNAKDDPTRIRTNKITFGGGLLLAV